MTRELWHESGSPCSYPPIVAMTTQRCRSGKTDKDEIVDCLLDFLGAPSEEMLKDYKKQEKAAAKASKKSAKQDDENKDYEVIEFGTMPNDKQLRQWVRQVLVLDKTEIHRR